MTAAVDAHRGGRVELFSDVDAWQARAARTHEFMYVRERRGGRRGS